MTRAIQKVLLVVLDGWGLRREREGNAISMAGTPELERIAAGYPRSELEASGLAVGLPEGQMGNSEVGHMNIGAGRIVYQDFVRISRACASSDLHRNPAIAAAMDLAKTTGRAFHLIGLVSDGGVHSSIEHLYALLRMAKLRGLSKLFVHAFLDGRDTPPKSGLGYIEQLESFLQENQAGKIATVIGRYDAMDRDKRWDRVQLAYDAMVRGRGEKAPSAPAAVRQSYQANITDEFVKPTVIIEENGNPVATLQDADVAMFFNFRADRARQLTRALAFSDFKEFDRGSLKLGQFVCITQYDSTFNLPVAFPPERPRHTFGEIVAEHGLRQFRTAETEKYAHVTFFFNGGREQVFPGEDRLLVPSQRDVKTYDLKPQMSAREVTSELIRRLESGGYHFALVNFANPDMVGHTGVLQAAIEAVRVVDESLGRIGDCCQRTGHALAITADHGNCEQMVDPKTGQPHTAHTLNPVPFHLIHPGLRGKRLRPGILADLAPTLLELMDLPKAPEMRQQSLLE